MLKVFVVDDLDFYAANSKEEVLYLHAEMIGEMFDDTPEVCEVVGNLLDKKWYDEDDLYNAWKNGEDPTVVCKSVGTLREWLSEMKEPGYIVGLEG